MPRNPKQDENLKKGKDTQFKSGEKAAKSGRKGGIASGESKRARKSLREELETLLAANVIDKDTGQPKDETVQTAISVALIKEALKGDTKAYEIIRDTIGEKPAQKVVAADIDSSVIAEVERAVLGVTGNDPE
jgi:hypothetical protein